MYEFPGATILLNAHKALEALTLTREVAHFKPIIEQKWAELVYFGLWFSPLKKALDAFIDQTQKNVSGTVRLKLYKGTAMVVGRKSDVSLYNFDLATYDKGDMFDHKAAKGFIDLWGLPTKVAAIVEKEAGKKS
jgi:argininosuccinate synthase